MSDEQSPLPANAEPAANEPVVTTRGLSDRSRQLLASTHRTDSAAEPARGERPHRVIRSLWWPLLYVVLALSIADVGLAPLAWGVVRGGHTDPLLVVCWGLVAAQLFAIAVGLVFGRDSLTSRLLLSSLLLVMMFVYGLAGYFASMYTMVDDYTWVQMGGRSWYTLAGMTWYIAIAALVGITLPLLAVRNLLRWELTNADELRDLAPEQNHLVSRYSLRDLLVLMIFVSVIFAIPRATYDPRVGRYDNGFFWVALWAAGGAAVLLAMVLAWLLWQALESPERAVPRWTWVVVTYAMIAATVGMAIVLAADLRNLIGFIAGLGVAVLTGIAGGVICLQLIHQHGWRIESPRRPLIVERPQ